MVANAEAGIDPGIFQARRRENYDWAAILASVSAPSCGKGSDVAWYARPGVEVVRIPDKGLGLRTATPASCGELLFVEPAFVSGRLEEAVPLASRRLDAVGPTLRAQFCALTGTDCQRSSQFVPLAPVPVERWGEDLPSRSLEAEEIRGRIERNAMATVHLVEQPGGYISPQATNSEFMALYPVGSLLNHDCCPSCQRLPLGPTLAVRAVRELAAGEELTVFYDEVRCPRSVRWATLRWKWGFECHCRRCTFEAALPPHVTAELDRCHQLLQALKTAGQASEGDLRQQVRTARRLAEKSAKSSEGQVWLKLSVFVLVAFELAFGLITTDRNQEAQTLFAEIEQVYAKGLPSNTFHACMTHYLSVAGQSGKDSLKLITKALSVHDTCYGGGVRTWRLLVRKSLPANVLSQVVSWAATADALIDSAAAESLNATSAERSTQSAGNSAQGRGLDAAQTAGASVARGPAESASAAAGVLGEPAWRQEERWLKAELELPEGAEGGVTELSASLLRVGSRTWAMPQKVDPSTARISWGRKRGVLRIKVALAQQDSAVCPEQQPCLEPIGLAELD